MDHDALVALVDRASAQGAGADVTARAREEVSELLLANQDRLFGLCLRFVGDPERALDLARTAIRVGVRRLGEWRGEGVFWTWWYGVIRDVCLRSLARKRNLLTADGVLIPGSEAASALAGLRREDWEELLRSVAMSDLPPDEQEAVYLRYVEGLEVTEITEVMQLQGTGARGLLQRSRHKLGLSLREAQAMPLEKLTEHAAWRELARVEATEPVRAHLALCPRCRVDRQRLRHPMGVRARDLEAVQAELEAARTDAVRTLASSWRSAMSRGSARDDAARVRLLHRHRRVGNLELDGLVKRTGVAVAYRARDVEANEPRLVEVLATSRGITSQIQRDVRQLRVLQHSHLVRIHDLIDIDGSPALVSELVDGPDLQELLRHEVMLPLDLVDTLAVHILSGMAAAHAHGVAHRDLRATNVLIDVSGAQIQGRVAGIGMARLLAATDQGTSFVTPPYRAPEQLKDPGRADARSDVFALGAVLYELATGQRCFGAADHVDAVRRVAELDYVPPTEVRPALPERMTHAIVACLRRDPDRRPKSAAALLDLWTRGAGAVVRTGHSLTEGEAASYRYLSQIDPLPLPPGSIEGAPPARVDLATPPAVLDAATTPRGGSLVAFLGVVAILGVAAVGALWSATSPEPARGPIPWRMARAIHDAVDPDLSRDGRTMLFSDHRHVYRFGVGEAQPTLLTKGFQDAATDPAWSADGRHIAFSAGGALWVMRANSRRATFVTQPAYEPSWSPDGTRIAFVTAPRSTNGEGRSAALKTVLIDEEDEDVRYVTVAEEATNGPSQPAYHPDGNRIAWSTPNGLRVAAASGGSHVPLPGAGWDPQWLDGSTLAALCEPEPGRFAVCTFKEGIDGWKGPTEWVRLTDRPRTFDVSIEAGRVIIGLSRPEHRTLHVAPYTTEWRVEHADGASLRLAASSPVGPEVVGALADDPGALMVRTPVEGWRPLVSLDDVRALTWRPDGSRVTVSGTVAGQPGVFDVDPESGSTTPLTDGSTAWIAPVHWSPWGRQASWTDRGVDPPVPLVLTDESDWSSQLGVGRVSELAGYEAGAFSPDGLRLLVHDGASHWSVYDLASEQVEPITEPAVAVTWWTPHRVLVAHESRVRLFDLETSTFTSLDVDVSPWTVTSATDLQVGPAGGIWISASKEAGGLQRLDLPLDRAAL